MTALQNEVFRAKATQLAEFEADKPRLKSFLHALSENRAALKKDVARLQAIVNKGTGLNAQGRPGVPLGIYHSSHLHHCHEETTVLTAKLP